MSAALRFRTTWRARAGIRLSRLARWEFWPAWAFYPPIVVAILARSARAKPFMAVTAANPCLKASGIVGETKQDALRPLQANAPQYVAEFTLLPVALPLAERLEALRRFAAAGPGYPLVLKPDIGQRGRGVAVIRSEAQAADYLAAAQDDVVAQRHIGGAEFGVFVYRDPNTARVELLSIVHKCFPTVTGDGRRSLGELILDDARARLIAQGLFERFASRLDEVPAAGDVVTLVEIGAHCRGSVFLDGAAYKTEALRQTMSAIVDAVPGYVYFAGTHYTRQTTWWEQTPAFNTYLGRCSHLLQQGLFVADALYYRGDAIGQLEHAHGFVFGGLEQAHAQVHRQRRLDAIAPRITHAIAQPFVGGARLVGDAEFRGDAVFEQAGAVRRRVGLRLKVEVENLFLLAAKQRENAVRGQLGQLFSIIKIVRELGALGLLAVMRVVCRAQRTDALAIAERRPEAFGFDQVDQVDVDDGRTLCLAVALGLDGGRIVIGPELGVGEPLDPLAVLPEHNLAIDQAVCGEGFH